MKPCPGYASPELAGGGVVPLGSGVTGADGSPEPPAPGRSEPQPIRVVTTKEEKRVVSVR
jgi:hypothetical protein